MSFEMMPMTAGGLRIGSLGLGGLVANHLDQPARQSFIAQLTIPEFLLRPARAIQTVLRVQGADLGGLAPTRSWKSSTKAKR